MPNNMLEMFRLILAVGAGALIGCAFGYIQNLALRRNQKLQESGQLNSGWAVMPGSGKRVASLVIALVVIQIVCPLLFINGSQWWVSGGVMLGYAVMLLKQMRARQQALKR